MGKGKGALDHYVAVVKPGRIMFEIDGVSLKKKQKKLCVWGTENAGED
jgi:large subunit ribosomal protein L16